MTGKGDSQSIESENEGEEKGKKKKREREERRKIQFLSKNVRGQHSILSNLLVLYQNSSSKDC